MRNDSLWVILIDISSSMKEEIGGKPSEEAIVEIGGWKNKLEAAKDLTIRQARGLVGVDLSIIAFNTTSMQVFFGSSEDISEIERNVSKLTADGWTDIGQAFRKIQEIPELTNYYSLSVLLISDGMSNEGGDPYDSAKELVDRVRGTRISTFLIGVDTEGEQIAKKISIGGEVKYAQTYARLSELYHGEKAASISHHLRNASLNVSTLENNLALTTLDTTTSTMSFRRNDRTPLQPSDVSSSVLPYIASVQRIQEIADFSIGQTNRIKFFSLTQHSPVKATVSGIAKALTILEELIIPWKREHRKKMCKLQEEEMHAKIEKMKAETRDINTNSMKDEFESEKILSEAYLLDQQTKEQKLVNEEKRIQLLSQKIQLGKGIMHHFEGNRDFSDSEKNALLFNLLEPLEVVLTSNLDVQVEKKDNIESQEQW